MTGSTNLQPDVPQGPATIIGYGTAAVSLLTALLAYVFQDGDEQTLGVIASGIVGLASLLWTNYGRQKQAVEQIRALAVTQPEPEDKGAPDMDIEALVDLQREMNELRSQRRDAAMAFFAQPLDIRVEGGSLEPSEPLDPSSGYAAEVEVPLRPGAEGLDPGYGGRDGSLETRLKLEQREACQ